MGTVHALTAAARRPARYRRLVRRTYSLFTLHYSLKTPGIVTEQNGERKNLHHTRIDSGGRPKGSFSPKKEGEPLFLGLSLFLAFSFHSLAITGSSWYT